MVVNLNEDKTSVGLTRDRGGTGLGELQCSGGLSFGSRGLASGTDGR